MSVHLTKPAGDAQSQIIPSRAVELAPNVTEADRYVLLCDWHGRVVWKSATGDRVQVGDELWKGVTGKSKDGLKQAMAGVVTLGEHCVIEVDNDRTERFRLWMWPLLDPESAICILAQKIPSELALLTDRERACLQCLACGRSTKDISDELEIGLTTVHTHLRRAREKLSLGSVEELIGFSARYFFVPEAGVSEKGVGTRKRSG